MNYNTGKESFQGAKDFLLPSHRFHGFCVRKQITHESNKPQDRRRISFITKNLPVPVKPINLKPWILATDCYSPELFFTSKGQSSSHTRLFGNPWLVAVQIGYKNRLCYLNNSAEGVGYTGVFASLDALSGGSSAPSIKIAAVAKFGFWNFNLKYIECLRAQYGNLDPANVCISTPQSSG